MTSGCGLLHSQRSCILAHHLNATTIERNDGLILVNTSVLRYNNKQEVRNTFHPEGDCLDGFTIYGLQTEINDE